MILLALVSMLYVNITGHVKHQVDSYLFMLLGYHAKGESVGSAYLV